MIIIQHYVIYETLGRQMKNYRKKILVNAKAFQTSFLLIYIQVPFQLWPYNILLKIYQLILRKILKINLTAKD